MALGSLDTKVTIFHAVTQLPKRVSEGGFRRQGSEPGAFDPKTTLPRHLKELLDGRPDFSRLCEGVPLGYRGIEPGIQHRVGKEPGGDLLALSRLDSIL